MNDLYPVFLKLKGQRCLVVGGGKVAARKISSLVNSGAVVTAVSIDFCEDIIRLSGDNKNLTLQRRGFVENDLEGVILVIAATNDRKINGEICAKAKKKGIFVNAVDDPKRSSFHVPASFTAGDLKIAISTGGKNPALAKSIKERLEKRFEGLLK